MPPPRRKRRRPKSLGQSHQESRPRRNHRRRPPIRRRPPPPIRRYPLHRPPLHMAERRTVDRRNRTRPHRTGRRPPPSGRQRLDEPRPGPRPRPRRTGEPMTSEEAVILVAYVRACCPQQKFDEYTPDAWHDLLGDLTLNDCRAAARTIAQRQPFVAPAEIRAEVARIRADGHGCLRAMRDQQTGVGDRRQPREAILAGNADPGTNPHARAALAEFRAKQEAARRRRAEQDRADREALRAYRDAVDALLALPDHGAAALATARDRVYGDTEAATGY